MVYTKKELIKVKDLVKNYQTGKVLTKVLKGLNFSINKGEFVGIMGPSGSGKSTTLHQLGLLDKPTSGSIFFKDLNVVSLSEQKRSEFRLLNLGYVFQQYRNIPELTALENVYLPARMAGKSRKQYLDDAKRLLSQVGLRHRFYHRPYEMSGGEQQRVAIARALINKPLVLFADEPTANLDTSSSENILDLLKTFNEKEGQTIIMVSHEPEQVKYFHRVVKIKDGLINK